MQKNNLNCRVRPKRRRSTGHPFKVVENIINVDFNADRPLQKLSTDITYLPFWKVNALFIEYYEFIQSRNHCIYD